MNPENVGKLVSWVRVNPNYSSEQLQQYLSENNITKEEFKMTLKYKGVGPRFFALIIDMATLLVIHYCLLIVISYVTDLLDIFPSYFFFIGIVWAYRILLEWKFGTTFGKWVAGIRVVKTTGEPLDFIASLVRNLMRWVDNFPLPYLIGVISVWCSPRKQRLGDRLAKTVVVSKYSKLIVEKASE